MIDQANNPYAASQCEVTAEITSDGMWYALSFCFAITLELVGGLLIAAGIFTECVGIENAKSVVPTALCFASAGYVWAILTVACGATHAVFTRTNQ